MIYSRPADAYPGGSSGAKRHTKMIPGKRHAEHDTILGKELQEPVPEGRYSK
ncbi:MAG: hypothetical protein GX946_09880 [Oligosphaeraceae bacterium]|nr:hypothetical protein [Oligosphaeraceae bacterium]